MRNRFVAVLLLACASSVAAQSQVEALRLEYSEVVDQVNGGKQSREVGIRVVYLARDGRIREEILNADNSLRQIELQNPTERAGYVVHPVSRTAHQWNLPAQAHEHAQTAPGEIPSGLELLGERAIQGFTCKGTRRTLPGNAHNRRSRTVEGWYCKDQETGLSFIGSVEIRGEGGHSHTRNLVRVQRGIMVDSQIFEVPRGYMIHPAAAQGR